MEQDEDANADLGRRARGDFSLCADGTVAGPAGDDAGRRSLRTAGWASRRVARTRARYDGKLKALRWSCTGPTAQLSAQSLDNYFAGLPMFSKSLLAALVLLSLPALARAAEITGVPNIRDGDQIQIGNSRIRL